ncbi:hypothetical protein E2C01_018665 [Portunus trituberculatus]|uniref:Uncharacterized protein n=1 Tax=Portunus trituberculatus TaxID=210409 RepID=A0A5B7DWS2_PORTR|nr:hypothetical protein [Portunus trituberculatus]
MTLRPRLRQQCHTQVTSRGHSVAPLYGHVSDLMVYDGRRQAGGSALWLIDGSRWNASMITVLD